MTQFIVTHFLTRVHGGSGHHGLARQPDCRATVCPGCLGNQGSLQRVWLFVPQTLTGDRVASRLLIAAGKRHLRRRCRR